MSVIGRGIRCDFCDKSHAEVELLVAHPRVAICNECVAICAEIISEERARRIAAVNADAEASPDAR